MHQEEMLEESQTHKCKYLRLLFDMTVDVLINVSGCRSAT